MGVPQIRYIVLLMFFALSGLIGIQIFLIMKAYEQQEQQFAMNVNRSLSNVIYRIEKLNIETQLNEQFNIPDMERDVMNDLDSMSIYGRRPVSVEMNKNKKYSFERSGSELYDDDKKITKAVFDDFNSYEDAGISKQFTNNLNPLRRTNIKSIFKDLLWGYLTFDRTKVDYRLVDSLMLDEFSKNGIDASFEYGIYDNFNYGFKYSTVKNDRKFISSEFQTPVYYLGLNNALVLSVFFPKKKIYLLKNIVFLLISCVFLVTIIITLFSYSINTIFKQKKLSELKTDLINNIAHELKTPVSTISLACQAMNDTDVMKHEELRKSYLNIIDQENKRLGNLVDEVLKASLLESGVVKLKLKNVDVHARLDRALEGFKLQLEKKNFNVIKDYQAEHHIIEGDEDHLTNLFFNMVDNAVKYCGVENNSPYLKITTKDSGSSIKIAFEDNGIGIRKENHSQVFDKLYRVAAGNVHNVKGYGLGLSYVKSITEKHKGDIQLESTPSVGSTFTIRLPIYQTS